MNDLDTVTEPEAIQLVDLGVIARKESDIIKISTADGLFLFQFGASACPFTEEPMRFLVNIYKTGFDRGRTVGRDVMKQRLRDLLGGEL